MTDFGRANFVLPTGAHWTKDVQLLEADGTTPVDLTGYTARMQVRATPDASTKILDLSSENGRITIDGPNGTVTVTIPAAQLTEGPGGLDLSSITAPPAWVREVLEDLTVFRGYGKVAVYDLELVSAGGVVTRLLQGQVCFDPEVTR